MLWSANIFASGGGVNSHGGNGLSSITTLGMSSGDHKAGFSFGFAPGAQGKAKPPSPGQTLLRLVCAINILGGAHFGVRPFGLVIAITPQELLREITKVMDFIMFSGRR